jgi:flagellar protein FlbD
VLLSWVYDFNYFWDEEDIMIPLKSLSGEEFYLNNDLIVKIEALPDTVITLSDGRTLRVKDTPQEIIEKIIQYKRRIYQGNLEVK